jgi:hypothetical protein
VAAGPLCVRAATSPSITTASTVLPSQPADPHFDLVVHATVDFLDATVKGHIEAASASQALVSGSPSLAAPESTPARSLP